MRSDRILVKLILILAHEEAREKEAQKRNAARDSRKQRNVVYIVFKALFDLFLKSFWIVIACGGVVFAGLWGICLL